MYDLASFSREHRRWLTYNFPDQTVEQGLMGVIEEVGEIAHVLLKHQQGIREFKDPQDAKLAIIDGVGDLVIFLDGFCHTMNIDLCDAIARTWEQVRKRDWQQYPTDGLNK